MIGRASPAGGSRGLAATATSAMSPVDRMFVAQALFHHKITVWGGDQLRALLHVDDMASCYLDLLAADAEAVKKRTGADIEVQPIPPEL